MTELAQSATTIDITWAMVPGRYDDEPDRWRTEQALKGVTNALELRMHCRYTRRTERFSVLYQGPGGTIRMEHGRNPVQGPAGGLICQASVIAATPIAQAKIIDVQAGDVLVINGQRMVILDDRPFGYPRLVTEAEAGLLAAADAIRAEMRSVVPDPDQPNAQQLHAVRVNTLQEMFGQILDLIPQVRTQYAAPAKR